MAETPKKLLVLVVDRDNDIGRKTGMKTPIIGFEENLKAAQALLLSDPEEADANAMFGALRVYRELAETYGEDHVEVATLAGEESEGIEADMKIMNELNEVLKKFKADGCIFISDGVTDQFVTPLITSKIPVVSIKRIVVRHSESVEQTWLVLGRYFKLLFTEPRYSKIFLGIPGIIMAIIGILYMINVASIPLMLSAIGIYFILRGFNVDQRIGGAIKNFMQVFRMPAYAQLRTFAAFTTFILFITGLYMGYITTIGAIYARYPNPPDPLTYTWWWLDKMPFLIGSFISGSVDLAAIALLITILANIVYYLFSRNPRIWGAIRGGVLLLWIWALLKRAGVILITGATGGLEDPQVFLLAIIAILGMVTLTVTLIVTRMLRRMYSKYFRRKT